MMTPVHPLLHRAVELQRAGRLVEAESLYHEILTQEEGNSEALHLLGLVAHQRGDYREAIRRISLAIETGPVCETYYYNLGSACLAAGEFERARTAVESAIRIHPGRPEALNLLGLICSRLGLRSRAVRCFEAALDVRPDFAQALVNLGNSLNYENRMEEAEACYRKALLTTPASVFALVSLGNLLLRRNRLREAAHCYEQALRIEPKSLDALNNLGSVFMREGRWDEALAGFEKALSLNPNHPGVHFNKAWLYLLNGEFACGWAEYDWRLRMEGVVGPVGRWLAGRAAPGWRGEPLSGKRILIYAEQGLGDTIQFCRYLPLLQRLGAEVILSCPPELFALLRHAQGIDTLLPEPVDGIVREDFDCHAPLLSLPRLFGTDCTNIPAPIPWRDFSPDAAAKWRERLAVPALKIGVVWAGRPSNADDLRRSCSLNDFAPLGRVAGVAYFSLQIGAAGSQLATPPPGVKITDISPHLHDFTDTAAAIMNLDLVISVDTAVAHLAGALGRPVWTLLPHFPDWRWMLDTESTPWYPTMRLLRQARPGEWIPVFERAAELLKDLCRRTGLEAGRRCGRQPKCCCSQIR